MSFKSAGTINLTLPRFFPQLYKTIDSLLDPLVDLLDYQETTGSYFYSRQGIQEALRLLDNFNRKEKMVGAYFTGTLKNENADQLFRQVLITLEGSTPHLGLFMPKPDYINLSNPRLITGTLSINLLKIIQQSLNRSDSDEVDLDYIMADVCAGLEHELHHAAEWAYAQSKRDYQSDVKEHSSESGWAGPSLDFAKMLTKDPYLKKVEKDQKRFEDKDEAYYNNTTEVRAYVVTAFYRFLNEAKKKGLLKKDSEGSTVPYREMIRFLKTEPYYKMFTASNKNWFLKSLIKILEKKGFRLL